MIHDHMDAAVCAGIDSLRQQFKMKHSKIIERTVAGIDDMPCVKLGEVRNGLSKPLFVGPAAEALIYLCAKLDLAEGET